MATPRNPQPPIDEHYRAPAPAEDLSGGLLDLTEERTDQETTDQKALDILSSYMEALSDVSQGSSFLGKAEGRSVSTNKFSLHESIANGASAHIRGKRRKGELASMTDGEVRALRRSYFIEGIEKKGATLRKYADTAADLTHETFRYRNLTEQDASVASEARQALDDKDSALARLLHTFFRGVSAQTEAGKIPESQTDHLKQAYEAAKETGDQEVIGAFIDTARANSAKQTVFWTRQLLLLQGAAALERSTDYTFKLTQGEMDLIHNANRSNSQTDAKPIPVQSSPTSSTPLSARQAEAVAMPINEEGQPLHPFLGNAPAAEREAFNRLNLGYITQAKSGAVSRIVNELQGYVDAAKTLAENNPSNRELQQRYEAWRGRYQEVIEQPYIQAQLQRI